MAVEPCPASLPLCLCGVRGCKEHGAWVNQEIDWRKARKRRKRNR